MKTYNELNDEQKQAVLEHAQELMSNFLQNDMLDWGYWDDFEYEEFDMTSEDVDTIKDTLIVAGSVGLKG